MELIDVFKKLFRGKTAAVGTSFEYDGKKLDEQVYLNLNVGEKKSGEYELVFHVEDLHSGEPQKQKAQVRYRASAFLTSHTGSGGENLTHLVK